MRSQGVISRFAIRLLLGAAACGSTPAVACVTTIPAPPRTEQSANCEFKEGEFTAIVASECSTSALLIGLGGYAENWAKLPNSVSDIRRIGDVLPSTFSQVRAENCSVEDLKAAILNFAVASKKADVVVIYISAHGFEYGGQNYIVPITKMTPGTWTSAANSSPKDFRDFLETNFVNISSMISTISPAKYSVIFLDACREDPLKAATNVAKFSSSSVIDNGGQLVVYSTLPTYVSYNAVPAGTSPGPFANAIAKRLITPHNSINDIITGLTAEVEDRTAKLSPPQRPFTSGSSRVKFYFRAAATIATPNLVEPAADQISLPSPPLQLHITDRELRLLDGAVLADLATQRHQVTELEMLANSGVGDAAYLLGFLYHYGVGVAPDKKGAKRWLEASVRLNSFAGKTLLAYILAGEGKADRKRAAQLFEDASAAGFPKAKANLGNALVYGKLGVRDKHRGWKLITEAAEDGYRWAIEKLATRSDSAESRKRAITLMQKLADDNDPAAANWLCMTFMSERNFTAAFPLCRSGAERDQAVSQGYLAILYVNGWGVTKSTFDARYWRDIVKGKLQDKNLPKEAVKWISTELTKIPNRVDI